MREIKFRAWDGEKMWAWEQLVQQNYAIRYFFFVPDFLKPLQYTGLKDKNGKEIYEGDVLRYESEDGDVFITQIVWDTGEENIFVSGFQCKVIRDITEEIYDEDGNPPDGWTGELEVIGNIYENKELI